MWRALAESVEKSELKKGDRVYIEGKIRTRKWNDKDGNQRFTVEIVADTFTIINRKRDKGEDSTLTESTVIEAASSDISF